MAATRATRRRLLLLTLVLVLVGGVAGLHVYQQDRRTALVERYRVQGLAAFEARDHRAALEHLGLYHTAGHGDGETLYAYAQARLAIPLDNGRHLVEGIRALELARRSGAPEHAAYELLELYNQIGNSDNALDLAERLLTTDQNDVRVHRAMALALMRMGEPARALGALERALELEPDQWYTHMLALRARHAVGEPPNALLSDTRNLVAQHPNDPRYELLLGYAHSLDHNREEMIRWLGKAATHESFDDSIGEQFIEMLVRLLDNAGLYAESRRVLATHVHRDHSIELYREMAYRLLESGRFGELAARLRHVDPATPDLTNARVDLASQRVLALHRLGRQDEARDIVRDLEAQRNHPFAETWSSVLRAVLSADDAPGTTGERRHSVHVLRASERALETFPEHALFCALSASAYEDLGEPKLARSRWRDAIRARPSWSVPRSRLAMLHLRRGEVSEAVRAAEAGLVRHPESVEAALVLARARAAALNPTRPDQARALLALIAYLDERGRGEQVLPLHVSVLANLGQPAQAAEEIREALEHHEAIGYDTLLRLAELDRRFQLEIADELQAYLERRGAVAGPDMLLKHALVLARRGEPAQGLSLIEQQIRAFAQDGAHAGGRKPWLAARAEYLARLGDPRATEAWIELADAYPDEVSFQRRALRVGAAEHEPAAAERALSRLRDMLGEASSTWRVERARWLLEAPPDRRDPAEATALLEELVSQMPDRVELRLLLARSYEERGLRPLAIRELSEAAERHPDPAALELEVARLQQSMHLFNLARRQLIGVIEYDRASPRDLRRAATLLADQGEDHLALSVLESLRGPAPGRGDAHRDPDPRMWALDRSGFLLLAELYQRTGQPQHARELIAQLLKDPTAAAIGFAADFYASQGDRPTARATLEMLDDLDDAHAHPAARALIAAEHLARFGEREEALARYRDAVDVAAQRPEGWRRLVAFHLRHGEVDLALAVVYEAREQLSEPDPVLEALAGQRAMFASSARQTLAPMLAPLVGASRADAEIAEALRVIDQSHDEGDTGAALARRVAELAEHHGEVLVLQELAARLYLAIDHPDAAAPIAVRAMDRFRRAAGPASVATHALAAAGHWGDARRAATEWRRRTAADPMAADMMIVDIELERGQPREALSVLRSYLDAALADPEAHAPVLARYARCLVVAGRGDEAADLLEPRLSVSATWRAQWMRLASSDMPDQAAAVHWLRQVAGHIDSAAFDERVRLAQSWLRLAHRLDRPELYRQAHARFDELVQRGEADASLWLQHGSAAEHAGDLEAAEQSYRRALKRAPDLAVARNNLAMVLLMQGGAAVEEAAKHAERAVQAAPDNVYFLDTLARTHAAADRCQEAIETLRYAVQLKPNGHQLRHLETVLEGCGDGVPILEMFGAIDTTEG